MTNKERLLATLQGRPVDRPPVNFYELNGYDQDPNDMHEYNIFNHPSWLPLLELVKSRTDRIVLIHPTFKREKSDNYISSSIVDENGVILTTNQIATPKGVLTQRTKRSKDINTVWEIEHFIKTMEDIQAYLSLPDVEDVGEPDISAILRCDEKLGESGLAAVDLSDALCAVASLFPMADYTIFALTERKIFSEMLERAQKRILKQVKKITEALPGRMYRIYGPEYASPPYLPPSLFREYVVRYDTEIVKLIHKSGGYARIHSHGNLSLIIDDIVSTGADALDPIEPPPQGDISLARVKAKYGKQLVLFGNIEVSEIETLEANEFKERVKNALEEGMSGEGRGFVLMPSACPIGRELSDKAFRNYESMAELAETAYY